jgi:hypothetical protein
MAGQGGRDTKQRRVDNQQEEPERQHDERQAEQPQDGPEDEVDHRKYQGNPDVPPEPAVHLNTGHDLRHDSDNDRQDEEPNDYP